MSTTAQRDPVERVIGALLEPLYEEQARRRGQKFSKRSGVPGVYHLMEASLGESIGTLSIEELAASYEKPEHPFNLIVELECSKKCGTRFRCMQLFAAMNAVACDDCRVKHEKADRLDRAKSYWESICPPALRETDKEHAGFPKAQYEATRGFCGTESLLLFGPSGKGKTRLGMVLIKRCLVKFNLHVGVMWPEQLKAVKGQRDTLEMLNKWGKYDVLMMDDSLLTGAQDEKVTDFLKDLLDFRMRHNRYQIVTSQIGSTEYTEQADKFENATGADKQRIAALLRRLKESCRVISFADATPKHGEVDF